jgi:hypothetical protein
LKAEEREIRALIGLMNNIPTIMIGKMEMEFPAMYIRNKFIGTYGVGRKKKRRTSS